MEDVLKVALLLVMGYLIAWLVLRQVGTPGDGGRREDPAAPPPQASPRRPSIPSPSRDRAEGHPRPRA